MEVVNQILDIFQGFRMPVLATDQYEAVGKPKLIERITPFINNNQPIKFVMLGYPMKSINVRDKVLGKLPDLAEEVSLRNFERFNNRIKDVYRPGVDIALVSDGYIFADLMDTPDSVVREYEERNMEMSKAAPIRWYDATDFYDKNTPVETVRSKVMEQFGISDTELDNRILFDADVNTLYRGMIKFMTGDLAILDFVSNSQLHKKAKIVARQMMFRNEAYSRLIQKEFADHIRLSMHPSINNGVKYSFQLIPGTKERVWTSPWHCALLIDEKGMYVTIHRKDAEAAGYELVYENRQPYYFHA